MRYSFGLHDWKEEAPTPTLRVRDGPMMQSVFAREAHFPSHTRIVFAVKLDAF